MTESLTSNSANAVAAATALTYVLVAAIWMHFRREVAPVKYRLRTARLVYVVLVTFDCCLALSLLLEALLVHQLQWLKCLNLVRLI